MRGPARADRREREELARWVATVVRDPLRLEALALSYASLDDRGRAELVEMIERTCRAHAIDAAPTLDALRVVTSGSLVRPTASATAYEEARTGAIVIRDTRDSTALVATIDVNGEARVEVHGFVDRPALAEIPLEEGLDRAARIVLRHLRAGGALPPGASRFAHLFTP